MNMTKVNRTRVHGVYEKIQVAYYTISGLVQKDYSYQFQIYLYYKYSMSQFGIYFIHLTLLR